MVVTMDLHKRFSLVPMLPQVASMPVEKFREHKHVFAELPGALVRRK
jgi:hypothetical protein